MTMLLLPLLLVFGDLPVGTGLDNGLARTPPMGYSTWNDMQCDGLHEDRVKAVVEKMEAEGFKNAGYEYINIDDCWTRQARGSNGELLAADAFKSGMAAIGEFIHSKGFKFGIYTSRGSGTCVGLAGSLGHEKEDAELFAKWGVDFVKNDGCLDTECFAGNSRDTWKCEAENRRSVVDKYRRLRDALNSTGRPVLYEMCGWEPWYAPVGAEVSNMFRVGADVKRWEDVYEAAQLMNQLGRFSMPGGWVHPDMLIGSSKGAEFKLTPAQSRAQFSLWSIFPSPLILGVNVRDVSKWDRETYTNPEVIAINQDSHPSRAARIFSNCGYYPELLVSDDGFSDFSIRNTKESSFFAIDLGMPFTSAGGKSPESRQCQQVWARPLQNGDVAVAAVNFGEEHATVSIPLHDVFKGHQGVVYVRDLWERSDLGGRTDLQFILRGNGGCSMLRLRLSPSLQRLAEVKPHGFEGKLD